MTWKIEPEWGSDFHQTAALAVETSALVEMTVEFMFNSMTCLVNADTDPKLLFREYLNASKMGWTSVGPLCPTEYAPEVQRVLDQRTKEEADKQALRNAQYEEECRLEKSRLDEKTSEISLEIANQELFDKWKAKNTDAYGACIFEYAEGWAKLMQYEMAQGKSLVECAEATSFQLNYLGITGYMYGAAVNILAKCWKYGEELRQWHNNQYGHSGSGVVNPAILAISANKE